MKKQNRIGILFFHRDEATKFFEIDSRKIRLLIILPSFLAILALIALLFSLLYIKEVKSNSIKKRPSIVTTSQVEASKLEDELKESRLLIENLTQKITSGSTETLSALALFRSTVGQKDLSVSGGIAVDSKSLKVSSDGITLNFNIINQTKDGSKISGHIFALYQSDNSLLTYPSDSIGEGMQILFTKGEIFTTYRFRPSFALFPSLKMPLKGHFKIIIFSRSGDLIYKETIVASTLSTL